MDFSSVKYCKIYPGIGIARIGNSPDEYFIGPEAPGHPPNPEGGFKDKQGRVKKQAARFRIYGFDDKDKVAGEITSDDAEITWTVQVANTKASWHRFAGVRRGMDTDQGVNPTPLRNKTVQQRSLLEIRPSARSATGPNQGGADSQFNDGEFMGMPVPLGEIRTDEKGRLIVLGGNGKSERTADGRPLTTYANNDFWHDDVSDGPVNAKVRVAGNEIPVTGAWVIVAPPKFAPHHQNIVRLYEVMEAAVTPKALPSPISFTQHVYPILARAAAYQWVNDMALRGHGPAGPGNFPDLAATCADNTAAQAELRNRIFKRVRNPYLKDKSQASYAFMPQLSGDEGDAENGKPETWLYLLDRQYDILEQWAKGNFVNDWVANPAPPPDFDAIDVAAQPDALNLAALEWCAGGAFFPGIEITYIARYKDIYSEPFRFDQTKMQAGDATKRMAVPWQADFYECQIHWWPAQRPDDVVNEDTYADALKEFAYEQTDKAIAGATLERIRWDRGLGASLRYSGEDANAQPGDNDMVVRWSEMGFVVPRTTPAGETIYVETGRSRYDGLPDRDYFYMLMNIDSFPDFLPKAKDLAQSFLDKTWAAMNDPTPGSVDDIYRFFKYTPEAFANRMEEIYNVYRQLAVNDPYLDPGNPFKTPQDMVERIRQMAPFNQADGAWLRNISQAGPIDEINSLLFAIWMDEAGDGNKDQNHSNLYTELMRTVGIEMPPTSARAYADNPDLLDSAFTVPVFELAISQFTRNFFPEILGMTLQLEWEVLGLKPTIKLLQRFGINPHFYELHVGIDNAASGHGAKAREAVQLYLDKVRAETGSEDEVQRQWRRIWTGYVTFATTGNLYTDLVNLLESRRQNAPTPQDRLLEVVVRKKPYARLNHGEKKLGENLINDWFEDPEGLLQALVDNGLIAKGNPEKSPFFRLLSFDGPMYKVFTDDEIALWREWTIWLAEQKPQPEPQPQPQPQDAAALMAKLIDFLRPVQEGTIGHTTVRLTGPDPANPAQTVTDTVAFWFTAPTRTLMSVISDLQNGWIVKGKPAESKFITQLLGTQTSMGEAFNRVVPDTGGKTGKDIATAWIEQGCPLPAERAAMAMAAGIGAVRARPVRAPRLTLGSPLAERLAHPRGTVQGMGAVH